MRFQDEAEAITYVFRSLRLKRRHDRELDEHTRDVGPTRRLIEAQRLLDHPCEYAVVTGSKGKGSTTVLTAKLLQHLGHTVGTITSPHLTSWRERVRVNGRAIPEADLVRILDGLAPDIDAIEETLTEGHYFSPQGIFLATALRWFEEQQVRAAVLEVGRGGRFDDIAVVPNRLSLFTPIMLEHPDYLGPTVERIAWHKAGIIKPYSYAYSVPQAPEVLQVLLQEAEMLGAEFNWLAAKDMGQYIGPAEGGMRFQLGRYGEVTLSLLGRYQIANASLAVIGAGNVHSRLTGVPHGSEDYVARIRAGLADARWPGRCQQLQEHPTVFVDGAINAESAALLVESLEGHLHSPVVSIVGVPADKDYQGVMAALAPVSETLIVTETTRNPTLHFLNPGDAVAIAGQYHHHVSHAGTLTEAVDQAKEQAGANGSILIVGTQSIVAEAVGLWGLSFEQI